MRTLISITAALIAAAPAAALEPQFPLNVAQAQPRRNQAPDVIFVPTPQEVVDEMLRLAYVKDGGVLYDLGSGHGSIPVSASEKFCAPAVWRDIHSERHPGGHENSE